MSLAQMEVDNQKWEFLKSVKKDQQHNPKDCEAFFRGLQVGDEVLITDTSYNDISLYLVKVTRLNPNAGRFYVDEQDILTDNDLSFYYTTGKNCKHPKGQCVVYRVTDEVKEYLKKIGL